MKNARAKRAELLFFIAHYAKLWLLVAVVVMLSVRMAATRYVLFLLENAVPFFCFFFLFTE